MIKLTDKDIWFDLKLLPLVDTIVYNINEGHDFLLIVSGSGLKRIGKSMFAQQLGYILSCELGTPFGFDNVVWGGEALVETAKKLPRRSVIIDDESLSDFDSSVVRTTVYRNLKHFMAECGMFNHIFILVAPNFFQFNRSFATTESLALINLTRQAERIPYKVDSELGKYLIKHKKEKRQAIKFIRGIYHVYNSKSKRLLYDIGKKKNDDYNAVKFDYFGEYRKKWVLDEEEYDRRKIEYIHRERNTNRAHNTKIPPAKVLKLLKERGLTDEEIGDIYGVSRQTIHNWKRKYGFTPDISIM